MPRPEPAATQPSQAEEAAIQAGIAADPNNREWSAEDFACAQPAPAVFDTATLAGRRTLKRRPGERDPQRSATKPRITIRLSPRVLETFRASGEGWQTRIDEALCERVARRR